MGARCLVRLLLQLGHNSEQRRLLERVRLSKLARRRQGRRRAREVVRVFHELGKECVQDHVPNPSEAAEAEEPLLWMWRGGCGIGLS